jgi:preprotein translocase subunit SecA
MLERNDALIEQFNKEEQKRLRLQRRKRARRKRAPGASKEFHKLLDRLDLAIERHKPADCISTKWIG